MRILCTMPGRAGDIFWALAAVRAVAEAYNTKVDFACSPKYAGVLPIVRQQEYIGVAYEIPGWDVQETAPMTPAAPLRAQIPGAFNYPYDYVLNLGYTEWPRAPLAFEVANRHAIPLTIADLDRPWIQVTGYPMDVVTGFTDEWFEMKYGLFMLLERALRDRSVVPLAADGSRWLAEGVDPAVAPYIATDLPAAATYIAGCTLFVGCLSSLAVLAAAMGKPRVLIEPSSMRHHMIFQHWDTDLVMGNDGRPTFDARALVAAVREKLDKLVPR